MKSTFALAALTLSALTLGCGSAPDDAFASDDAELTSTLTATSGATSTLTGSTVTVAVTAPERVYVFPASVYSNCVSLRGTTGTWVASRYTKVTGALAEYCRLEWVGSGVPQVVTGFPTSVLTTTGRQQYADLPVTAALASSSTALVDASWSVLRGAALKMAGTAGAPLQTTERAAFVGVVDSARQEVSTGEASTGSYEHGEVVGRIVREIGGAYGALHVLSTTGLPRGANGAVSPDGGYYGYTSDVAEAIVRAVDAWRTRVSRDAVKRPLVLNLSLGWEPANYLGVQTNTATSVLSSFLATNITNVPQRSVFQALQYASCAGALIFAAAGNASEGPGATKTLMYPAAFESIPAPTAQQCKAAGFSYTATAPSTAGARLVYAVGGLDARDADLYNARTLGLPRLAAYGDSVSVTRAPALGGRTGVMTGTSMATAVASAVAAYSWSFRPSMSGHDVVEAMYAASLPLGRTATACTFAGSCEVRRVSLCESASKLLGLGGTCTSTIAPKSGKKVAVRVNPANLGVPFAAAAETASLTSTTVANPMLRPAARPMPVSGGCDLCGTYSSSVYLDIANPAADLGATISFGDWGGYSFTASDPYMLIDFGSALPSYGTITFTSLSSGWTFTDQLLAFY
jgi:hypothetical protein